MPEVQAMLLDRFGPGAATDDGQHVVLQAHVGGRPAALAIRQEDVFRLMALLSKVAGGLELAKDARTGGEHAYPITAISSRPARQGDGIVLTAQIPGGMQFLLVGPQPMMTALGAELIAAAPIDHDQDLLSAKSHDEAEPELKQASRNRLIGWLRKTAGAAE